MEFRGVGIHVGGTGRSGKLDLSVAAQALGGSVAFAVASRVIWTRSIAKYTSASS